MPVLKKSVYAFLLFLLLLGLSGCCIFSTHARPDGFEVIDMRRARDVAMPAPPPIIQQDFLGNRLAVGEQLQWIDGSVFERWMGIETRERALSYGDPIFADVYYGLNDASEVRRPVRYSKDQKVIGTVYWVDSRIGLIADPAGSPVYVLERDLSEVVAKQFEAALLKKGYSPGEIDGVIDQSTRAALAQLLDAEGLPYRFANPAISEAVLELVLSEATN